MSEESHERIGTLSTEEALSANDPGITKIQINEDQLNEIARLKEEMAALEKHRDAVLSEHDHTKSLLVTEIEDHLSTRDAFDKQVDILQSLKSSPTDTMNSLAAEKYKHDLSQDQNSVLLDELSIIRAERDRLQNQVDESQSLLSSEVDDHNFSREEISDLKYQRNALLVELAAAKQDMADLEEEIGVLYEENDNYKSKSSDNLEVAHEEFAIRDPSLSPRGDGYRDRNDNEVLHQTYSSGSLSLLLY